MAIAVRDSRICRRCHCRCYSCDVKFASNFREDHSRLVGTVVSQISSLRLQRRWTTHKRHSIRISAVWSWLNRVLNLISTIVRFLTSSIRPDSSTASLAVLLFCWCPICLGRSLSGHRADPPRHSRSSRRWANDAKKRPRERWRRGREGTCPLCWPAQFEPSRWRGIGCTAKQGQRSLFLPPTSPFFLFSLPHCHLHLSELSPVF